MPGVSLDRWRSFARERIRSRQNRPSGIQSVVTEQNYIAGLSSYRVGDDLCHGPVMVAEHFVALDLFDRAAVVHALAEFLEDLGRQHGCRCVHTHILDSGQHWQGPANCAASILQARGHAVKSMRLCKSLEAAPKQS